MKLFAWGENAYGQLGLGTQEESVLVPTEVDLTPIDLDPEDIMEICGGAFHTLLLDNRGNVYCCGSNAKGQLGTDNGSLEFQQVEVLAVHDIAHIDCGWEFSAAVTSCGKMFVWGNNANLQLGLGKCVTCTGIPSRLHVSQRLATGFTRVSCGMNHMAMITANGDVVVAGTGSTGALGVGDDYKADSYMSITKVRDIEDLLCVASGQNHTACLRNDGMVFTWGENDQGQLGLDPSMNNVFIPSGVFLMKGLEKVDAGRTSTSLLTKDGEIYNWGRNDFGQLGSEREMSHIPEKLVGLNNVAQLSCGSEHTLAVTNNGQLFVWGYNEHGACGTGDDENVPTPREIIVNQKVKAAFACAGHSFALVRT